MPYYVRIDGIEGNVSAKGFDNHIEFDKFAWSAVKRNIDTVPGRISNRESTSPTIGEIVLTKVLDQSAPLIFGQATYGKAIPTVDVYFTHTGDNLDPYLEIKIYNVIVSGYQIHGDTQKLDKNKDAADQGNKEMPHEFLTLNFDKVEVKYTPYDEMHKPQAPIHAGYDLKTAVKI